MSRQERLNDAWCKYMNKCSTEIMQALAFALRWADEHPNVDVRTIAAWRGGYEDAIEKACDLLYEYNKKQADKMFGTVHTADVTINVAEFRKAMESSCSEFPNNSKKGGEK